MVRSRLLAYVVPCALVLGISALLVPSSADAASRSGVLGVRSSGSAYTANPYVDGVPQFNFPAVVSEAVNAGNTATFELRVLNPGAALSQYRVRMETFRGVDTPDESLQGQLSSGSVKVTSLATSPEGYVTKPLAGGKFEDLVLKVTMPKISSPNTVKSRVTLTNPSDGTVYGVVEMRTELALPSSGNPGVGVIARQGSQPFVGRLGPQLTTSAGLKVGASAVYEVRLVNLAAAPTTIGGEMFSERWCSTLQVKDGSVDVTASLFDGSYRTPSLKAGAYRKLTVTFKRTSATGCSPVDYATFESFVPVGTSRQTTGFVVALAAMAM